MKRQKHDIQFAEVVQSKLVGYDDLELELRGLREENEVLRSRGDNVDLMRYQLQTLQERVERNGDLERRVGQLEVENAHLREERGERGRESTLEIRYFTCVTGYVKIQHFDLSRVSADAILLLYLQYWRH